MSRKNSSAMLVFSLVAVLGVFAGNASADTIYDYDFSRVSVASPGPALVGTPAPTPGQDGWYSSGGGSGMYDIVSSGGTGWEAQGNYCEGSSGATASNDAAQRINDANWSFNLVDNVSFDFSCIVRVNGGTYTSFGGLSNSTGGATNHANLGCGVDVVSGTGYFYWAINKVGYGYTAPLDPVPTGAEYMFLVGDTFTATGSNSYSVQRYTQNLTLGGAKTSVGSTITYTFGGAAPLLSAYWDRLTADCRAPGARVDDIRIDEIDGTPEPSTLALLATGLIGLLCYAWRKRR